MFFHNNTDSIPGRLRFIIISNKTTMQNEPYMTGSIISDKIRRKTLPTK